MTVVRPSTIRSVVGLHLRRDGFRSRGSGAWVRENESGLTAGLVEFRDVEMDTEVRVSYGVISKIGSPDVFAKATESITSAFEWTLAYPFDAGAKGEPWLLSALGGGTRLAEQLAHALTSLDASDERTLELLVGGGDFVPAPFLAALSAYRIARSLGSNEVQTWATRELQDLKKSALGGFALTVDIEARRLGIEL